MAVDIDIDYLWGDLGQSLRLGGAGETQVREMKKAFVYGVHRVLSVLHHEMTTLNDEEAHQVLDRLARELDRFVDGGWRHELS